MVNSLFTQYIDIYRSIGNRTKRPAQVVWFRERIVKIVPWRQLEKELGPHYYSGLRGRPPTPLKLMLRLHILQRLHDYSDSQAIEQLADSLSAMEFCDFDPTIDKIPERTVLTKFRKWLKVHSFDELVTEAIEERLDRMGVSLAVGKTVPPRLIQASGLGKDQQQSSNLNN